MGREIVSKQEFYRRPGSKAWKFKDFQTKELWHEACVLEHVMKELSKCCMEFQKDKERKDKEEEKEKRFRIASTELNEISSEYLYMVQPAFALNYGIIGASEHDFEIEKFIEFENNREKTRFKVESHDVGNMVKCFFLFTGCIRRQIYLLKKFQSQVSPVSNKYLFEVFFQQTQGKTIVDRTEFDVSSDEKVIIDYIDPLDSDNFSDFASKRDFSVLNCSFRCLSLAIKLTIERSTRQNAPAYQAAPVRIEKVKSIDLNLLEKTIITGGNSALKATLKSKKFESSSDAWKILARCVSGGLIETSKALLEKVLEENEDRAPLCDLLMLAADAGQHRLIQHLLEIEVSLDSVTDDDGRTALTRACMTGQVRAAKVLLDHGANALHKDKDTSIQLAEKFGHYQIVRLLDGEYLKYRGLDTSYLSLEQPLEADASKSIALHKLLKEAGFTWQRAKLQQKMADSMEDIVRQIHENNEGIHVVGSFAEGWGSSLTQLNGQASDDCDINWTCLVGPREPVHLLNGCSCKAVKKTRFEVKQGYVQVDAMIGSEPAMTAAECGSKPAESFCFANPCCSNSIAEQTVMRGCFEANALPLHLVRAARPTADHELRISFSFLEKAIMRSLTDCQGQLYILMKFVLNRLVSGQVATAGLKTYHAKTLLLYLLHEHGFDEQIWRPDNLIRLLNESLDKLLEFIDSGPDPDICMPSFFLPDSPLYFANAGVGGDFQQTKSRVRDQLKRLRTTNLAEAVVQKLQHQLKPLQNENFYFHPFTMVPLQALNPLQTEGNSEITVSTFGKLYDVVRSYFELFSDKAGDAMALLKPLENLTWCKTTAACLNILLLYKVEDFEAAKKVLKGLDNHTVMRSWKPDQIENMHQVFQGTDWAWRFCLPCPSEVVNFSCLPEFTRNLLVIRKSRTGSSHLYVNFCCLAWSLRAELLGATNSELDAWFSKLQEYPDFEEHMTIAHYSSSKEQVQFCLAKMETILTENRLAFDTRDWDNVERLRNKLKNLVLNEYTTKPARRRPQDWSDEDLNRHVHSSSDLSIQLPPFKETLLVIAAKKNRSDIVEKLLEKVPAVASICDVSGRSALSWASFLGHLQPVKVFRRILDENVLQIETNRPDNMRQTPLMLAAHSGHDEVVSELLQMDADLNLEDRLGYTALTHAAKKNFAKVVKILLDSGSSIRHADRFGNTPVIWAARQGCQEVLKVLSERIDSLQDWEVVGEYKRTSLQWAELGKHWECAAFIRECIRQLPNQTNQGQVYLEHENPEDPDNSAGGVGASAGGSAGGSAQGTAGGSASSGGATATQRQRYDVGNSDDRLAIVINNIIFNDPARLQTRVGAERDDELDCLPLSLQKLGFKYHLLRDVGRAFFDEVRELRILFTEDEYKNCTAFLLCIMSHGFLGSVYSSDGAEVKLDELFGPIQIHQWLKGKPKIFITQACRHVPREITLRVCHGLENFWKNEDSLYIYSVVECDKSDRNLNTGTVFIQKFKDSVLEAYSDDSPDSPVEFTHLLPKVTSDVLNETGNRQIPCYKSTLLKLLFFPKF
ncbi:hypothetical protein BOX15_Mlig029339g1 [Macrostomum lignano]|uniref:Caspase family p20 domain-containing protein n=1 Tax=Macrostomum lignano TaxID=282301 RepID=A0A267E7E3_9PLAT|nr:hypothetical protein BOX15_Mlig029339g1 [Macrostomum lignano]